MSRARILALALCLLPLAACHSPKPPPDVKRTPVEKPWTKATIEAHENLWLELSNNRHGYMTGPVLATDDKGEYLTTKDDPSVHLPLADVLVMDAVEVPPPKFDRAPIEKPWTKERIEAHDHVWIETSTGRRQLIAEPILASDDQGEFVTTKSDPTVHVPLAEIVVLDVATQPSGPGAGEIAQSIPGSIMTVWAAVWLFLPAIILVALLA